MLSVTQSRCPARRRGALHTGALTTCAVRHKLPDGVSGQAVVGATADGALFAAALLLDGQTAQALLAVQRALTTKLEHAAGLNPTAFRCFICQAIARSVYPRERVTIYVVRGTVYCTCLRPRMRCDHGS